MVIDEAIERLLAWDVLSVDEVRYYNRLGIRRTKAHIPLETGFCIGNQMQMKSTQKKRNVHCQRKNLALGTL